MIVKIDKSFQRDIHKIKDQKIKKTLAETIHTVQQAETLSAINNFKKLTGYKDLYRIRLGNYRIGIRLSDDQEIILIRFLHRKEIYQKWP